MVREVLQRGQFTFYASYLDAVEKLPKNRKCEALLAIVRYGLRGEEPVLTGSSASVFAAIRPHLENGRIKAAARLARSVAPADHAACSAHWADEA